MKQAIELRNKEISVTLLIAANRKPIIISALLLNIQGYAGNDVI